MKKMIRLTMLFCLFSGSVLYAQSISERGYPEHFAAGAIIGGTVSYFTYKKTNNKFKAWAIGFGASATVGLVKELVDPVLFNGTKSAKDFGFTALGGAVGASIVIPLGRKEEKVSFVVGVR